MSTTALTLTNTVLPLQRPIHQSVDAQCAQLALKHLREACLTHREKCVERHELLMAKTELVIRTLLVNSCNLLDAHVMWLIVVSVVSKYICMVYL